MRFSFGWDRIIDQIARKARIEVEGGLYHVTTRGVDRRDIFHSPEDYRKFVALFAGQKEKLAFYLYAYCLIRIARLSSKFIDDPPILQLKSDPIASGFV